MKCTERRRGKRMRRCDKQQRKEEIGVEGGGNELYRKGEGRACQYLVRRTRWYTWNTNFFFSLL